MKGHQRFICESAEKLDREERIPGSLFEQQVSQRLRALLLRLQGIGKQPRYVVRREGTESDLLYPPFSRAEPGQHSREWVRWIDLVVSKSADQQQVTHLRVQDEMLDQIERRRIQPLQIIEEQRQRVLRPGKHSEEPPEYQLEARLLVLRRQPRRRRLLADDQRQLRNETDHQLPIRAERLQHGSAPLLHLRIAFAEDLVDQALEGLGHRRVGDVPLVLVELARGEQATRRHQHLVQLVDNRGL